MKNSHCFALLVAGLAGVAGSRHAALATASPPWLLVVGDDEPTQVTANVEELQHDLVGLLGSPVAIIEASALTEAQRSSHQLILVGQYDRNAEARRWIDSQGESDFLLDRRDFEQRQGFLVAAVRTEGSPGVAFAAIGRAPLGATYAASRLRTQLRSRGKTLSLAGLAPSDPHRGVVRTSYPSFSERAVYYNFGWEHAGSLSPLHWTDDDWEQRIDKLVCAQLTHIYFFLWSDHLYFAKSPENATQDHRLRHERLQRMIRYAHGRGLKVAYQFAPSLIPRDIFRANESLLKASIVYTEQGYPVVCSAVGEKLAMGDDRWQGAWELMLDVYRNQIEHFREADAFQLWFYDPAGCFCGPEKHDCRGRQAERLMEQVDRFYQVVRQVQPNANFTISMWPVWALEPMYQVRYRDEAMERMANYVRQRDVDGKIFTLTDTLTNVHTTLPQARNLGLRTNGFIFPTNCETGCTLFTPMIRFLAATVRQGREYGVDAIHHMRIEETTKYANTYLASRFYWNADLAPEEALDEYVGWIANKNPETALQLHEAISLLDRFLCDGADQHHHGESGPRIQRLVESALASLDAENANELEWLLTTGKAAAFIGRAIDAPNDEEQLAEPFAELLRSSPSFGPARTPLSKYVAWIRKGWTQENF